MSGNDDLKDLLLRQIADIRKEISSKRTKQLGLDLTEKIVHRLSSFSHECMECENYMHILEVNIADIMRVVCQQEQNSLEEYFANLKSITTHLQKKHKLVTEGYYTGLYMSIGTALGLPLGMVFSQRIGNKWSCNLRYSGVVRHQITECLRNIERHGFY